MSQPPAYNRTHNFSNDSADQINRAAINNELDDAAMSINAIRDNLALIQRDDGALRSGIVTVDTLSPGVFDSLIDPKLQQMDNLVNIAGEFASEAQNAAASAASSQAQAAGSAQNASQFAQNAAASAAEAALDFSNAMTIAAQAVTTANAAATTANGAVTTANGVDGKAQSALDNSVAALNTANGINGKAQSALDNSVIAINTANSASTTANGINAKATQAQADAAAALIAANNALASTGDISHKADIDSPTFTGSPRAPTPPATENSTRLATTHYVSRGYLPLTGGTLTGNLTAKNNARIQGSENTNPVLYLQDHEGQNRGNLHWNRTNGQVIMARYDPDTGTTAAWLRLNPNNTTQTSHAITAPGFNGNATSATKLSSAPTINGTVFNATANITTQRWGAERTLKIGNQSMVVNGSENVTWTLSDIGARSVDWQPNLATETVGKLPIDRIDGLPEPGPHLPNRMEVGNYMQASSYAIVEPTHTVAGIELRPFLIRHSNAQFVLGHITSGIPNTIPGTWRNVGVMESTGAAHPQYPHQPSLFIRIA